MEYLLTCHSAALQYTYTLNVYVPDVPAPPEGFPVIYVLDGRWYYEFAKNTVALQSRNYIKTGVKPSIVVGICHDENDIRTRRFYDFTAPAAQYVFPARTKGKHMDTKEYGGAVLFFTFLEEIIKPTIARDFSVNGTAQTLYGHSLGGYFAIWCYLYYPTSFTHYIAVSPSVWWNDLELLKALDELSLPNAHLAIAVGEQEHFMVEEITMFYEHLETTEKSLYIAPEENHASVVPTTMSRLFRTIRRE